MPKPLALAAVVAVVLAGGAGAADLRPVPRPVPVDTSGGLCGHDDIRGERLARIDGDGQCGVAGPVRLDAVAGVALEPPPVVGCRLAHGLRRWLEASAKPAFGEGDDRLVGLGIAAGYVCRTVNDAEDGALSEHSRGRAIDIARFERAGGTTVTVLEGWAGEADGDLLRKVHAGACGIFGTALGPDSDAFHADHLHYDIAPRRRPYCP